MPTYMMEAAALNKVNANPLGAQIVTSLVGGLSNGGAGWNNNYFRAYQTALIVMHEPTITTAIKAVKNLNEDPPAWADLYNGIDMTSIPNPQPYLDDIRQKYSEITGRTQQWKTESKMGAGTGRRPTILTSGRGAGGAPAMALTKLKKQLGR